MAHGVPLALADEEGSCGTAGPFFLDAGISSTHHIASFWGLDDGLVKTPRILQSKAASRTLVEVGETTDQAKDSDDAVNDLNPRQAPARFRDPRHVIDAALRAAGLPVPTPSGVTSGTDTTSTAGQFIEAALKAAGLKRG
jgi:hypothetical protein